MPNKHLYNQTAEMAPELWERAYTIALENRKFEIDNYWKRTTYFWTIIAATFVAYAASVDKASEDSLGALIITVLGSILSLAWILANKGSKYWQQNWEAHVDLIEDQFSGPLYKTVLTQTNNDVSFKNLITGACAYSVSKVNLIVSMFVFVVWVILFLNSLFSEHLVNYEAEVKIFISIIFLVFVMVLLIYGQSRLAKERPKRLTSTYSYIFREK